MNIFCPFFFWLTWNSVDGPERPEDPDCSNGREVQFLHVQAVFQGPKTESKIQPRNGQYSRALKQKVKISLAIGSIPGPSNSK
jgi:hypothetical protein